MFLMYSFSPTFPVVFITAGSYLWHGRRRINARDPDVLPPECIR